MPCLLIQGALLPLLLVTLAWARLMQANRLSNGVVICSFDTVPSSHRPCWRGQELAAILQQLMGQGARECSPKGGADCPSDSCMQTHLISTGRWRITQCSVAARAAVHHSSLQGSASDRCGKRPWLMMLEPPSVDDCSDFCLPAGG